MTDNTIYHDNLEQGSLAWFELREEHDTASEAPAVMGISPFKPRNPRELAAVKRGDLVIEETLPMQRGKRYEAEALAWINAQLNMDDYVPCVAVRGQFLASMDGLAKDRTAGCEIKIPMNWDSSPLVAALLADKMPPDNYLPQIVQQAHVCQEMQVLVMCAYNPETQSGVMKLIEADELRKEWPKVEESWAIFHDTDWGPLEYDITKKKGVKVAARKYGTAKAKLAAAQVAEKEAKKGLIALCEEDAPNVACGFRITPVESKGNIDWDRVKADLELSDEWLEGYRKPGRSSVRITGEFDDGKKKE